MILLLLTLLLNCDLKYSIISIFAIPYLQKFIYENLDVAKQAVFYVI